MTRLVSADVAIVGSGPAGVAVAEQLSREAPQLSIAMIERGPLVLRRHFYHDGGTLEDRDRFLDQHRVTPWLGELGHGGSLLPVVGGRGTVGGAQLHRFYPADLGLWTDSPWPIRAAELTGYFELAESRILGNHSAQGPSQRAALELFESLGVKHPPHSTRDGHPAVDSGGYPHRSSVERLLWLVENSGVQLHAQTMVTRLVTGSGEPSSARAFECRSTVDGAPLTVEFQFAVLAASPVESARLVLNTLPVQALSAATGRYLAEHIYARGFLDVSDGPLAESSLNIFIPPQADDIDSRFQLEIRSAGRDPAGRALVRVTGSAAQDPSASNRVWLRPDRLDEFGSPRVDTRLRHSAADRRRTKHMIRAMEDARTRARAQWSSPPVPFATGGSFHESGTLRMGSTAGEERASNADGLIDGFANVYTGDAAAFPTVGVANPILTLTALGYRLGDHLSRIASAPSA